MNPNPIARQLYVEGDVIHDLLLKNRFGIVRYVHPMQLDAGHPEWEYTIDWESEAFQTSTIMKESEIELTFRQ